MSSQNKYSMSEAEVHVPLQSEVGLRSYASMEKNSAGEIKAVVFENGLKNQENHSPENNHNSIPREHVPKDREWAEIRVFTLNCWGLQWISKRRVERMEAIGHYLSTCDYDIVLLQEVWMDSDYKMICHLVRDTFPFAHHFNQGIIGSGTCILSRVQLQDANFHEFAMNGYPTSILHGDWYAAKGVGVCQIDLYGFNIHIFVSHYHAEYDPKNDVYLSHRVIHALESAQWIKLTSSSADLTIYGGDFNTEPNSVPYHLLRGVSNLSDAWVESGDGPGGETNEIAANTFTPHGSIPKRIDYIMYCGGPGTTATTQSCHLPMSNKAPNLSCSFSDHEGVAATIRIQRSGMEGGDPPRQQTGPQYRRMMSLMNRVECVSAVTEARKILLRSMETIDTSHRFKYILYSIFIVLLLIISYIPSFVTDPQYHLSLDLGLFFPRMVLIIFLVVNFLMATLFYSKERHALEETLKQLQLLLDQNG